MKKGRAPTNTLETGPVEIVRRGHGPLGFDSFRLGRQIEYDITEELEEIGAEELYGQLPSETQQLEVRHRGDLP